MTTHDKICDEKLSIILTKKQKKKSGKNDEYECLTHEEILPPDQSRMIEQAKFTNSLLGKAFEKQIKTIEDQEEKQINAIEKRGKQ